MSDDRPWMRGNEAVYKKVAASYEQTMRRFALPLSDKRQLNYVLVGHDVVPADLTEWTLFLGWSSEEDPLRPGMTRRHVDDIVFGHDGIGTIRVSTVFLGLDHRFTSDGPPLVFETMIFGGGDGLDGYTDRCSTWDEAVAMHREAVEQVKNAFSELAKASGA